MNDRMFDSPVFVKHGAIPVHEIACLDDALEFLYEWPQARRGPIFNTALRACRAAFEGSCPVSSAKSAFASFARSADILDHVATPSPWASPAISGHSGGALA